MERPSLRSIFSNAVFRDYIFLALYPGTHQTGLANIANASKEMNLRMHEYQDAYPFVHPLPDPNKPGPSRYDFSDSSDR